MQNKVVVITGASDGIGAAAARRLKAKGAEVVIVGRSPERTKTIAEELGARYYLADFSKLRDVPKLADDLRRDFKHIDVLANNAGGIFSKREMTEDGHEITMQVNHLAPFLLTTLLMDILTSSNAVVINTSSVANKALSKFDVHDIEVTKVYTPESAYGNAKLANILFTKELHRRYHDSGICAVAFHPGNVATSFAKDSSSVLRIIYTTFFRKILLISPEKGADTLVWLASTTPGRDWEPGQYYVKRKISGQVNRAANDASIAKQLWGWSAEAVKLQL